MKTKYYVARTRRFDPAQHEVIKPNVATYAEAHALAAFLNDAVALEVGGYERSVWYYVAGVQQKDGR